MPQRIDKLAKSRTANWFQLQCWSKCGYEGRSMVGQEWHRWDQTDLRGLLRVLHAPRAVLHCGRPTEHWLFYQSLCRGSNWWDTVEKPNKQTEYQRESAGRAGWRCRKWKPCDQQSCPLPLANWSPAPVLHTGSAAQNSAPGTLNCLHTRGWTGEGQLVRPNEVSRTSRVAESASRFPFTPTWKMRVWVWFVLIKFRL